MSGGTSLLNGETLRAYLERNPQPKISDFVGLILPAMAGVEAAHRRGVIHRDLKPENIFLAQVGGMRNTVVKVLDFGIAKLALVRGPTLTRTGAALGTPLYMSLEQLRGDRSVDQRADVYAFGVMLYEAVTGLMPYDAETLPELAIKVATTDAPPVKSLRPDVPTALARIIDWAVARERDQRLPDLQTLQQELAVFAQTHGFRAQMTNPEASLPRLPAEFVDATGFAAPSPKPPPRAAPAPPRPAGPGADTLRASEIDRRSLGGTPSGVRSRWLLGSALAATALSAGTWWVQNTNKLAGVAKDSPPATAVSEPPEAPATSLNHSGQGVTRPAASLEAQQLRPLAPPGAAFPAAAAEPAPVVPPGSKPTAMTAGTAVDPGGVEMPPSAPLSEEKPPAPTSSAVSDTRPKVRAPPAVAAKPKPSVQQPKPTSAQPATPTKKTPRDLIGF